MNVDQTLLSPLNDDRPRSRSQLKPTFGSNAANGNVGTASLSDSSVSDSILTLGQAYERYISDPTQSWSARTRKAYDTTRRLAVSVVGGEVPVAGVSRAAVRDFIEVLRFLPRNASKRFPGLTARAASERSRLAGGGDVISAANVGRGGQRLNNALAAIEDANLRLRGVFNSVDFANQDRFSDALLEKLLAHFEKTQLRNADVPADMLGDAYLYLIKMFAEGAGKKGGEFYTPRQIVRLMVAILDPQPGMSIYDPTCGSGGMLLEAVQYLKDKGQDARSLSLYGQEKNFATWGIAEINLFTELQNTVRPKEFIAELVPHIPEKYSPIRPDGGGNQVYLAEIPEAFAAVLVAKIGMEALPFFPDSQLDGDREGDAVEAAIEGRTDIGPTQKQQLIQARRGQGIFRASVFKNEMRCRVTGISDRRFLIASHIKPWSKCTDRERLDGCNGLMLAPHIDCLFDKGFISFDNDGTMLVAQAFDRSVLECWSIDETTNAGPFNAKQLGYLEYHRTEVLQS